MALETNTLVDGEWTTRTLDVNTILRHYDQQDKEAHAKLLEVDKAPVLGLLTQTIIRSPLVNWILPAKLRSAEINDVAFIGDGFVQIRELRSDGQLCDVIRKENFGARIRNARVVGKMNTNSEKHYAEIPVDQIKDEDNDVDMGAFEDQKFKPERMIKLPLPPQFLLLQLDSGDSVFLMLRHSESGDMEFVSSRHRLSRSMLRLQPGMHLAVDPSSRYMAIGCSEGIFAIYSLYSRKTLNSQYSRDSNIRHVESERYIYFNGVIHKMEFLYPSADDEKHVILLVLLIVKGKTRMLLYEWETGTNLRDVRAHSHRGHLLEESRQMPLLLIPLTIKSAFILVSEQSMAVCEGIVQGTPKCTDFNDRLEPPTALHHGAGIPLWTSWTRPIRLPHHTANRDDIYIAREDGLIKFLEIDSEEFVNADMNIGNFDCNIGTAFASLDYHQQNNSGRTGDLLITGGDSCAGGTYLVTARKPMKFIETIQNWSPAQDFIMTSEIQDQENFDEAAVTRRSPESVPTPGRVFACVGKGAKGTITEFRYGLEGNLGLETEYDTPIMQAWVSSPTRVSIQEDGVTLFLLSLGDRSAVLQLSSDATEIVELDQSSTQFDLRYRTVTASLRGPCWIQVTEQTIVLINGADLYVHTAEALLRVHQEETFIGSGSVIDDAVIHNEIVLFSTHLGQQTYLKILEPVVANITGEAGHSTMVPGGTVRTLSSFTSHVTCLSMCLIGQNLYAVIAEWSGDSITLTFHPISGGQSQILELPAAETDNGHRLEAFVSIAWSFDSPGYLTLLCGTRNGFVVTLEVMESTFQIETYRCHRFGATPAMVLRDEYSGTRELFLVSCDSNVYALTAGVSPTPASFCGRIVQNRRIYRIWVTDTLNPALQQPSINSVARLEPSLFGGTDGGLLLVAGTQLLLAGISTQPKAVPRHLPIGGTPSRLLYSHTLRALIVAASVNGKSTLLFIDPETGADLSSPVDRRGVAVEFVSGLGNSNERAFRLMEWPYVKDGKTWQFIIVCTSSGRLLIISTGKDQPSPREPPSPNSEPLARDPRQNFDTDSMPKIRYWTRHKFKCTEPVYSVAGFADGLFYCTGNSLYCETLDLTEKRFKRVAEYELPSPAVSLCHKNGSIYALTSRHSLEILELVPDGLGGSKIIRTHSDQVSRHSLHHKVMRSPVDCEINLISDKECSVAGLWATQNTKSDTLETLFEAQLPYSVLRFRSGKCRPIWDPVWNSLKFNLNTSNAKDNSKNLDIVPNSPTLAETLGLAIDGSLSHYTVLVFAEWKFLRFLINLAMKSPTVCEFTYMDDDFSLEPVVDPKIMMHVDGDILQRILEYRCLEELLRIGQETQEASTIYATFRELFQDLHRGMLDNNVSSSNYVEQAYADLESYLRPVL